MKNINIIVENKKATVVGLPVITCGNSDYTVTFAFDDEWNLTGVRTARFVYVKRGEVMHEDKVFEGNTVAVPVLSDVAFVNVGVFAGDLCTTTPARVACRASILCGSGAPQAPTPDVYSQIMALFNSMAEKGAFGATEEQMQLVENNRQAIAALEAGTKKAGDAEKFGGQLPDYYATAESVENVVNGTTKVWKASEADKATNADDAKTLQGHGAEYFAKKQSITNIVDGTQTVGSAKAIYVGEPFDGTGMTIPQLQEYISTWADGLLYHANAVLNIRLGFEWVRMWNEKDTTNPIGWGHVWNIHKLFFYDGSAGMYLVTNGNGLAYYINCAEGVWSNVRRISTLDDLANYLPLTGGKISKASGSPLQIENTVTDVCTIDMFGANNHIGSLGFYGANTPVMINTTGEVITLLHTGNSAKVHIGTSAPSDTNALWVDTSA